MRQEGRHKLSLNGLFMLMWFIIYLPKQAMLRHQAVFQTSSQVIGLVIDINKVNIRTDICFNGLVDRIAAKRSEINS